MFSTGDVFLLPSNTRVLAGRGSEWKIVVKALGRKFRLGARRTARMLYDDAYTSETHSDWSACVPAIESDSQPE